MCLYSVTPEKSNPESAVFCTFVPDLSCLPLKVSRKESESLINDQISSFYSYWPIGKLNINLSFHRNLFLFVYLFIPLILIVYLHCGGLPGGASGKEPICQCRRCERHEFNPWVGKTPWRRAWQPSSILVWRILWTEEAGGPQSLGLKKSQRHLKWQHARTHLQHVRCGLGAGVIIVKGLTKIWPSL